MKAAPNQLHGLPVISISEAANQGFQSITIGIHAVTEKGILANVAQFRNPERCAFIRIAPDLYELALKHEDVSDLAD